MRSQPLISWARIDECVFVLCEAEKGDERDREGRKIVCEKRRGRKEKDDEERK